MGKKFQVFISSTYEDLKKERDQVIKAILEMGHIPVGMEMFSAADEEQWKMIQRQIDESDYYVVVAAHKYGSVTEEGLSYTEKEYDYAVSKEIPVLGFVIDTKAPWPSDLAENSSEKREALDSFKEKIKGRLVNFWSTKDDLHAKVSISLMKAILINPQVGWVRSDEAIGPDVIKELTRLSTENAIFRSELEALRRKEQKFIDISNKEKETIETLRKNKVDVYIAMEGDNEWPEPIEGTLLEIFEAIAPNLLIENTFEEIGNDIALDYKGTDYRRYYPVPKNVMSHWLADLSALDLVEPSKKKHPVSDNKEYWCLSSEGRSFLKNLRKLQLRKGLIGKERPQNEPDNEQVDSKTMV